MQNYTYWIKLPSSSSSSSSLSSSLSSAAAVVKATSKNNDISTGASSNNCTEPNTDVLLQVRGEGDTRTVHSNNGTGKNGTGKSAHRGIFYRSNHR